jgi:hydroxyacylglutathione hydrolase
MPISVKTITVPFVLNVSVNCYLIGVENGYILIDSGRGGKRRAVEQAITAAGCQPGDLRVIVLTHGDFDHSGNARYLSEKFGAPIAMHRDDVGMVEFGDMTWNRQKPNIIIGTLMDLFYKLGESERFTPEVLVAEGDDLADYGLTATIIEIPGHSKGSIGILSPDGHFFCGDLLANTNKPALWSIIDDQKAARASVDKLKSYAIETAYPGHGRPFPMADFWAGQGKSGSGFQSGDD